MATSPDRKMIGKALQDIRKNAGFKSAEAFAAAIGMKTSAYTEYEQGRRSFSYEQAWIMADALKCSMDELGGREWPPGGAPVLTPEEARLVDNCRRADAEDRAALAIMAAAAAIAGEAKKESQTQPASLADADVSEEG